LVGRQGFAAAVRKGRPEAALKLAPFNSRSLSAEAERVLAGGQDERARRRAAMLATRALRRDPTNVSATATLGLLAALRGRPDRAMLLFAQAQRLSRRDFRTRIWFIEDAVARGDVDAALRHYDIALRTSRIARDALFPVLSAAIAQPRVRTAAATVLDRRPSWADPFLAYAATSGPDPAALFHLADLLRSPLLPGINVELIRQLVMAERFDLAWARYSSSNPGAERRALRAGNFQQSAAATTQFDWNGTTENGLSTIFPDQRSEGLEVQVASGAGGVAVSQLQLLTPGRYRFSGRVRGLSPGTAERPYWALICASGSKVRLGRIDLRASGDHPVGFTGDFVVPPDCPAQSLQLIVVTTDDINGVAFVVERVALRPTSS
jgi:tetratricopeptide (TPR) repeat protein